MVVKKHVKKALPLRSKMLLALRGLLAAATPLWLVREEHHCHGKCPRTPALVSLTRLSSTLVTILAAANGVIGKTHPARRDKQMPVSLQQRRKNSAYLILLFQRIKVNAEKSAFIPSSSLSTC